MFKRWEREYVTFMNNQMLPFYVSATQEGGISRKFSNFSFDLETPYVADKLTERIGYLITDIVTKQRDAINGLIINNINVMSLSQLE